MYFLVLLYLNYMCMCSISRISPSWARAGCKETLCLLHYPRKIKFIHSVYSFIHSFTLSLQNSTPKGSPKKGYPTDTRRKSNTGARYECVQLCKRKVITQEELVAVDLTVCEEERSATLNSFVDK